MVRIYALIVATLLLSACSSMYYGTLEKVGIEKRDVLVDRIEDAADSQDEAKEQFESALAKFRATVNFDGGELEDRYDELNSEYKRSKNRAEDVRDRVDAVQSVAEDLFEEWEEELDEYSNRELRNASAAQLRETKRRYQRVEHAMDRALERMDPVLEVFQDQVLFLKHNLNARAISSLSAELDRIESDVQELVEAMEDAINEAQSFIQEMRKDS